MADNLLTAYSFLAALTENETDIYKTVYVPICKRAISLYAKNHNQGTDSDIKNVIETEYGISIPSLIVRKLIKAVAKDLSKREKTTFKFEFLEEGRVFQFKSFIFNKIEDIYEREKRNANALQNAFEAFCKAENETIEDIPSFAYFIDRNKQKLSSFFAGRVKEIDNQNAEVSFMPHIEFLMHIEKNHHELYKAAKQIYLGSIIASFLESDINLEVKIGEGIAYYLDTQIILEALDLQKAEDTQPTLDLLKLIKETGGRTKVLDITIGEIRKIMGTAINNYNKDSPTTTINDACVRNNKNKTWLINTCGKLESFISDTLNIDIDKVSEAKIEEYSKTEDVKLLEETRYRKGTAAHDVIAYLYVREKRNREKTIFIQKAKYWFITANKNLSNFNRSRKLNGYVNEIIMPEELTSLLFLTNPKKLFSKVSRIGLNELIAQTLSEEYASKELINEFDTAIKSNLSITKEDYDILLSSIALESTTKIQRLLKDVSDTEKFNQEVHQIIEKTRSKRRDVEKEKAEALKKKEYLENINSSLSQQLSNISNEVSQLRAEKTEERDLLKKERIKEQKRRNRINWIFISIIILLVGFIIVIVFPNIVNWLKGLIYLISSLSGLWGLINLIINIFSKIKK
ncbi:MAG: hypothetical protein KBG30_10705 [Bacteroidales bacterium]|nr:hypothetical protein [Bacteroidales bacterium]